jgi:hypothetical protein
LHKRQALYERIIIFIPVFAVLFTTVASAIGIGLVITNYVMKLFVSGEIVQSAEPVTSANNGGNDESHSEAERTEPEQQEGAQNQGKQPDNSPGADNSVNKPEASEDDNEDKADSTDNLGLSEPEQNNGQGQDNSEAPSNSEQYNNDSNSQPFPSEEDIDYDALVKPSIVTAVVKYDVKLRDGSSGAARAVGDVTAGKEVVIIRGYNSEWYNIETKDGQVGWVTADALDIPDDPETSPHRLTVEQLEGFVEYKKLNSSTEYLVWVDIDRQLVNVFKEENGKWKLERSMVCATGRNRSPTLRGTFKIEDRGPWFYNERLKSGAKYWVRYSGPYLFHSVAMNRNQEVDDPTLGKRASFGCIRLSIEDSEWFYDNIPKNTTVFIY